VTSPLARAADVGRWLKRWGFRWQVDAALAETDFGGWDGRRWSDIPPVEFERWMQDFRGFDFTGGESLEALMLHAAAWQPSCALVVGHAGWITARQQAGRVPTADAWPSSLPYGRATSIRSAA
jgi:alpha-ribazole phosphatase